MRRRLGRIVHVAYGLLVALFLMLPTLVVLPMSFNDSKSLRFPIKEYSTRWYQEFFTSERWLEALRNSLVVGISSTVLAVLLGTLAALALTRGLRRTGTLVSGLLLAPMIVPTIVVGLAMYFFALKLGLAGTYAGLIAAHTVLALPYVVVNVTSSLSTFDIRLERAARSLGAGPVSAFLRVTIPGILPGIGAGALFAFSLSFDEVVVSIFLTTAQLTTLPVAMWSGVTVAIDPTVAAISSLLVVVTMAIVIGMGVARALGTRLRRRRSAAWSKTFEGSQR